MADDEILRRLDAHSPRPTSTWRGGSELVAENRQALTGHTWRRIALELQRLHLVTLTGPTGTIAQITELTDTQRDLFAATSVAPPPRITALQPA